MSNAQQQRAIRKNKKKEKRKRMKAQRREFSVPADLIVLLAISPASTSRRDRKRQGACIAFSAQWTFS